MAAITSPGPTGNGRFLDYDLLTIRFTDLFCSLRLGRYVGPNWRGHLSDVNAIACVYRVCGVVGTAVANSESAHSLISNIDLFTHNRCNNLRVRCFTNIMSRIMDD